MKFRFSPFEGLAGLVEFNTTFGNLPKVVSFEDLASAVVVMQKGWRSRLRLLYESGYPGLTTHKLAWSQNCPPCAVGVSPAAQPCTLRVCPFCAARAASSAYKYLLKHRQLHPSSKLITYTIMFGGRGRTKDRIFTDGYDYREGLFNTVARHKKLRKQLQLRIPAIAGVSRLVLYPRLFKRFSSDGAVGAWCVEHNVAAVVPQRFTPGRLSGRYRVLIAYNEHNMAAMVGKTFDYKHALMTAPATVVADLVVEILTLRTFSRYGRSYAKHTGSGPRSD